tara:strand:+ start:3702 stop:4022 length:321 start_codon:yes stop_codon:yes gene_type:complete
MDFNKLKLSTNQQNVEKISTFSNIDIYVKQRNGRKYITTIHGLGTDKENLKVYSKDLRKLLGCSCSISNEDDEIFLKLSTKDTTQIINYLREKIQLKLEDITIHGD